MRAKRRVCIREYGYLIEGDSPTGFAKGAAIPRSAFRYLQGLLQDDAFDEQFAPFLKLTTFHRKTALKLQNYVGVLQTPCGTQIEILPKLLEEESDAALEKTRGQLINMLSCLRDSPVKQGNASDIRDSQMPLLEIYIQQFLQEVNRLVKRGVRSDYVREQKQAHYLKGRLLVAQQIRKNSLHPERFNIECDEYRMDRPANRLIKRALELVGKAAQHSSNQRLARELGFVFDEVPASSDVAEDFRRLKLNRSMGYYQNALSWCRLLLNGRGPTASSGHFNTLSLLYPMERVFEDFVAYHLRKNVQSYFGMGTSLKTQTAKQSLVESHAGKPIFRLKPDLTVLNDRKPVWVMDTKWKLIDANQRNKKYGISQADVYQLFAYGHKYLKGSHPKQLMLIYPKTESFQSALPEFHYEHGFSLRVVPFDLDTGTLLL
jgi:5-methylcytosine-specific restriction enzyme subunit McrC